MNTRDKAKTLPELLESAKAWRAEGKKIVSANGCFDLLHSGHVDTLEWARSQGDVLVVGINADASVRANKGPNRPVIGEEDRARMLAGLAAVDAVLIFKEESPIPWLRKLKPDIHVKGEGSEKHPAFAPEEAVVNEGGGKVVLAPKLEGFSTTDIIARMQKGK